MSNGRVVLPLLLWRRGLGERRPYDPLASVDCSGAGSRLVFSRWALTLHYMNPTGNARRLRRKQTREEAQLWQALRAGRFAGFKFRRQHPFGGYFLDVNFSLGRAGPQRGLAFFTRLARG